MIKRLRLVWVFLPIVLGACAINLGDGDMNGCVGIGECHVEPEATQSPPQIASSAPAQVETQAETVGGVPQRTTSAVDTCTSTRNNNWVRPGAHPYQGSVAYALHILKDRCNVPSAVHDKWRELIKGSNPSVEQLVPGTKFSGMMWSSQLNTHRLWTNVVMGDWAQTYDRTADVYRVEHQGQTWVLVRPHICDNWAFYVEGSQSTSTAAEPPAQPVAQTAAPVQTASTAVDDPYVLRIRFWEWDSIPAALQARIREVNSQEGNETYPFEDGAVSRDLDGELMAAYDDGRGSATTVSTSVQFQVNYPSSSGWEAASASPGDHSEHPNLVYWERTVSREAASQQDSQFLMKDASGNGCQVMYPRVDSSGVRLLSTRLGSGGNSPSELAILARSSSSEGANLNAILDCL